jgi:hypothetical protein
LRHLNTLIDTIRWLVTSTGPYVNGVQLTDRYCEHTPERDINANGTAAKWPITEIKNNNNNKIIIIKKLKML